MDDPISPTAQFVHASAAGMAPAAETAPQSPGAGLQRAKTGLPIAGSALASAGMKPASDSTKPIVEYAPALILRKRSAKGLTETLKRIKERIEDGEAIPDEFADLAETKSRLAA